MKFSELNIRAKTAESGYNATKKVAMFVSVPLFLLAILAVMLFASAKARMAEQEILDEQRAIAQDWAAGAIDDLTPWLADVLDAVRYISQSDVLVQVVSDVQKLAAGDRARLALPEVRDNSGDPLHELAGQYVFQCDALRHKAMDNGLEGARVVDAAGLDIVVSPRDAGKLSPEQARLVKQAVETRKPAYGPVSRRNGKLVVDLVDPLPRRQDGDAGGGGYLLTAVAMDDVFAEILSERRLKGDKTLRPLFLLGGKGESGAQVVRSDGGKFVVGAASVKLAGDLTFGRRQSATGQGDVWSLGRGLSGADWQVVLEKPAELVDEACGNAARSIYLWGLAGGVCAGLLLLVLVRGTVTRKLLELHNTIRSQKQVLDNVTRSMQVGLGLVDGADMEFINPDYFTGRNGAADLTAYAGKVRSAASGALNAGQSSTEVTMDGRLYRIDLSPLKQDGRENAVHVAIFKDITEYRRRAEEAVNRQRNCLDGLVHGIECALDGQKDHKYIEGRSRRLQQLSSLLGERMRLPVGERETLRLAARLSQIGKVFVPRDLMNSERRFDPADRMRVQMASYYAYKVLEGIPFTYEQQNLPVAQAVYQMGGVVVDRELLPAGAEAPKDTLVLEGSGGQRFAVSIRQLSAGEMTLEAHVLRVANDFCAMVSKRGDREPLSLGEAKAMLQKRAEKLYAPDVVRALVNIDDDTLNEIFTQA